MTAVAETKIPESISSASGGEALAHARRRIWEIDALRGTAVVTMIIYHFMWDLVGLGVVSGVNPQAGFWYLLQRFTCITFISLAGLSVTLVNQRFERQGVAHSRRFLHFVRRGLWIFMWGMVISIALWAARYYNLAQYGIEFGVLHLIGVSTILAYPFLRFKWVNVLVWAALFAWGSLLMVPRADALWLVWLGYFPGDYMPVDYFPLVPWFGVFLLGVAAGNWLYPDGQPVFTLTDRSQQGSVRFLRFLGRHSLPIYLTHQLVLFALASGIAWLVFSRYM